MYQRRWCRWALAVLAIPLAISEGLLTALAMNFLVKYSQPELAEIGILEGALHAHPEER